MRCIRGSPMLIATKEQEINHIVIEIVPFIISLSGNYTIRYG